VNEYIPNVRDKHTLTQQLIKLLPTEQQPTAKAVMAVWWYNIRRTGGLRLTQTGFEVLSQQLELENWNYKIDNSVVFDQKIMLKLDKKMQLPYYIHAKKGIPTHICFFGSREAVMANLYGNLLKFLDNYNP